MGMILKAKRGTIGLLAVGTLIIASCIGFVAGVDAQSFKSGNNVTVAEDEVVDSTLYVSGRTIDIAGKVNGDVICVGQNVSISAEVEGDIICAAQTLDITGNVEGSIRVTAQTASISSQVENNASIVAQTLITRSSSQIGRDMGLATQTATLNGGVGRDLTAAASSLTVNGPVDRNVEAEVEQLSLGNKAKVGGNLTYTSQEKLEQDNGASVAGKTVRKQPAKSNNSVASPVFSFSAFGIYLVIAMLVVSLALVLIMPASFHRASDFPITNWTKTLAVGVVASFTVPFLVLGLLFTLVGIPLAILLAVIWLIVLFLSGPFAAYLVGRLAFRRLTNNAILTMLGGSLIVLVLYIIPIINLLTMLAALWFGIGMILQQFHPPKPQYSFANSTAKTGKTSKPGKKPAKP